MKVTRWAIVRAEFGSDECAEYLKYGWEPFGVVAENMGHVRGIQSAIYLRKALEGEG